METADDHRRACRFEPPREIYRPGELIALHAHQADDDVGPSIIVLGYQRLRIHDTLIPDGVIEHFDNRIGNRKSFVFKRLLCQSVHGGQAV